MGASKLVCKVLAACVFLYATPSQAGGFAVSRFSGEHGHPTTSNATAVYFNPGALTLSDGTRLLLDLNIGARRVTYDRSQQPSDVPDPPDARGANRGRAS